MKPPLSLNVSFVNQSADIVALRFKTCRVQVVYTIVTSFRESKRRHPIDLFITSANTFPSLSLSVTVMSDLLHSALQSAAGAASNVPGDAKSHDVPYSRPGTPGSGPPLQLGFVGLGAMGFLMARNLAAHRGQTPGALPLLVWNRTVRKSEKLVKLLGEDKIRIAQSLEQIATESDVIFTNLASDEVVKSVFEQFNKALKVGGLWD